MNDEKNLFGVLSNFMMPDDKEPKFVFETRIWKGFWEGNPDEPEKLVVNSTHGYRVDNWDEDIDGGPGLCFFVEATTPKGKPLSFQIIVPKDELIKALELLADPTPESYIFDWQKD